MRIVQLANLVTPTSGGIRTVLDRLGRGYGEDGHDVHRIVPAATDAIEVTPAGVVHHLAGVPLPRSGGYRLLLRRAPLQALLDDLAPDRIEVSDRFTLPWVGPWARARGIPATVIVHERLAAMLRTWVPAGPLTDVVACLADGRLPDAFDRVVVPSAYAARAFPHASNVEVVPLGVDLEAFHPGCATVDGLPDVDGRGRRPSGPVRLVAVTRLSREKRPGLAIDTLAALRDRGVDAHLDLVGDGPLRSTLAARACRLPVDFHGYVPERAKVASLLARADVALATCSIETFGLAALEALACGTPVVAAAGGAVEELVAGDAGAVAQAGPREMAGAVRQVLARDPARRRASARARAECHPWRATVSRMLEIHGLPSAAPRPGAR